MAYIFAKSATSVVTTSFISAADITNAFTLSKWLTGNKLIIIGFSFLSK